MSRSLSPDSSRAFTLAESLVAVAIVSLLGAFSYGALKDTWRKTRQVEDLSAGRRIIQAYLNKAADDGGVLPKGYYARDEAPDISMPDGSSVLQKAGQKVVIQRYPWHLAPYLDWKIDRNFLTWANRGQIQSGLDGLSAAPQLAGSMYYYSISVKPVFGQNAYGVGGYESYAQGEVATRLAEVPSPGQLIVFLTARDNGELGKNEGYFQVEPPRSVQNKYYMNGSSEQVPKNWSGGDYNSDDAKSFGYVALNHGNRAVAAFLDGHVALLGLDELRDSRHWSRVAQEKDDPQYVFQR